MTVFFLLIALLVPAAAGLGFLRAVKADGPLPWRLRAPCAFILGCGLLTHWMLLLSITGIAYSPWSIHLPLLVAAGFMYAAGSRRKESSHVPAKAADDAPRVWWTVPAYILLACFIGYMLTFIAVRALTVPIKEWDAISWIAFKGKVLYYQRGVYPLQDLPNSAYPVHTPMLLAWVAMNLGGWSETLVKIVFPAYFFAYALLHYGVARMFVNRLWALGSLALMLSVSFLPYHATIAYRDSVLMAYFCAGVLTALFYWQRGGARHYIVPAVLFGLGSFVKLEGAMYMGIGVILLAALITAGGTSLTRANIRRVLTCALTAAGIFLIFFLYKKFIGASSANQDTAVVSPDAYLQHGIAVLGAFGKELFLSANWHLCWLFFALMLPRLADRRGNPAGFLTASATVLFILAYVSLGTFTGIYVSIVGEGSSAVISRVLLHVFPLAAFAIIMGAAARPPSKA